MALKINLCIMEVQQVYMQDRQLVPLVFKTLQLAARIWHWNRTSWLCGELQASDRVPLICMGVRGM